MESTHPENLLKGGCPVFHKLDTDPETHGKGGEHDKIREPEGNSSNQPLTNAYSKWFLAPFVVKSADSFLGHKRRHSPNTADPIGGNTSGLLVLHLEQHKTFDGNTLQVNGMQRERSSIYPAQLRSLDVEVHVTFSEREEIIHTKFQWTKSGIIKMPMN